MSDGYMMYVVDREYIEVVARSVLYACHSTFISYNQRSTLFAFYEYIRLYDTEKGLLQ